MIKILHQHSVIVVAGCYELIHLFRQLIFWVWMDWGRMLAQGEVLGRCPGPFSSSSSENVF